MGDKFEENWILNQGSEKHNAFRSVVRCTLIWFELVEKMAESSGVRRLQEVVNQHRDGRQMEVMTIVQSYRSGPGVNKIK